MSRRGGRRSIRHSTRCLTASKPIAPRAIASRDGGGHLLDPERLHQAQHLHELAFAWFAHAGLQQAAQRGELLRQLPAGQRRGLVQRVDLLLDQRQVVQRIEHEVLPLVGAGMPGDDLRAAGDHHLVHVPAHEHLAVPKARRHRVVVAPVAHQRQRGDARRPRFSQASYGGGSGFCRAARSRSSRSPMVSAWPRRRSLMPLAAARPADARSTPRSCRTPGSAPGSCAAR